MVSSKMFIPMLFALAIIGGASSAAMKALRVREDAHVETAIDLPFAKAPQHHHRRRRLNYVGRSYDYKATSACGGKGGKAGKGGKGGTAGEDGKGGTAGKGGKAGGSVRRDLTQKYGTSCDDGEESMDNSFEETYEPTYYPTFSPKIAPTVQNKEEVSNDQNDDDKVEQIAIEENAVIGKFEQLVDEETVLVQEVVGSGTTQTDDAGPAQTDDAGPAQTDDAGTAQTDDAGTEQNNYAQMVQNDDGVPSNDDPNYYN